MASGTGVGSLKNVTVSDVSEVTLIGGGVKVVVHVADGTLHSGGGVVLAVYGFALGDVVSEASLLVGGTLYDSEPGFTD